jgi:hypothetical protein
LYERAGAAEKINGQKFKLHNQVVKLTYPEARVILNALPSGDRHVYLLEEVRRPLGNNLSASSPEK